MAKHGDLLQIAEKNEPLYVLLVGGTNDPDSLWFVQDEKGTVRRKYADSCELLGLIGHGLQHLHHEHAAIRMRLLQVAESKYGREMMRDARMPTTVVERRGKRRIVREDPITPDPKRTSRGKAASVDPPDQAFADDRGKLTPEMDRYLATRDPGATDPAAPAEDQTELDGDAREVLHLDRLRKTDRAAYQRYIVMLCEKRTPADVARLLGVTREAAKKRLHRYRRIILDERGT